MTWCLVLACLTATSLSSSSAELVELSYTYNVDAPTYPAHKAFSMTPVAIQSNSKIKWKANEFCSSEHSGTHIDAPNHFIEGGIPLEAIPTYKFWRRPGVVVDMTQAINRSTNNNYEVRVADLEDFENTHGVIPDGAIVFIRTGQASKVNDIDAYSGREGDNLNFPGLGNEAAEWLVQHKEKHDYINGIFGLGVDTLSIDKGNSEIFPVHFTLLKRNIYGIENVANLDKLPPTGFYVTILPMRIGGGTGAPSRIVAEFGDTVHMHAAAPPRLAACLAILLTTIAFNVLLQL